MTLDLEAVKKLDLADIVADIEVVSLVIAISVTVRHAVREEEEDVGSVDWGFLEVQNGLVKSVCSRYEGNSELARFSEQEK